MKLSRIDSTNAPQPSWQIVKDWESIISKELGLPIRKDFSLLRRVKSRLNKWNLSWIYKLIFINTNYNLRFIMTASSHKNCDINKYTIPVIIDFWLNKEDLPNFYNAYKDVPIILLTNLEVYNFLKKNQCPIPIAHWPLSYPDKNAINKKPEKKEYQFCFIGRSNPFFVRLIDKYCSLHPNFIYIQNNNDIDKRQYVTNTGVFVAEDTGRQSYLDMIKKTKITCYTTPGIDEAKKESSAFNQVTPRLFEIISNQCHVIGHYPSSDDTNWYELNKYIPNVENYQEFEKWMDYYLKTDFDISKASEFLSKHYTTTRIPMLKTILESHGIEIKGRIG